MSVASHLLWRAHKQHTLGNRARCIHAHALVDKNNITLSGAYDVPRASSPLFRSLSLSLSVWRRAPQRRTRTQHSRTRMRSRRSPLMYYRQFLHSTLFVLCAAVGWRAASEPKTSTVSYATISFPSNGALNGLSGLARSIAPSLAARPNINTPTHTHTHPQPNLYTSIPFTHQNPPVYLLRRRSTRVCVCVHFVQLCQ